MFAQIIQAFAVLNEFGNGFECCWGMNRFPGLVHWMMISPFSVALYSNIALLEATPV